MQAPRQLLRQGLGKTDDSESSAGELRSQAVALAQQYLAENGLHDIFIDQRRYEPSEQWQRLQANDRISPFWKYTAGTLDVMGYTLLPRRALHSDVYSPFTNTLSINSTDPTQALYQAARAKEYRKQRWLGTYAALQRAPFVSLLHHAGAATDVFSYAQVSDRADLTRELYPDTYSELGSAVVSDALFLVPLPADAPPLTSPIARLMGGTTGRLMGKFVASRQATKNPGDPAADGASLTSVAEPEAALSQPAAAARTDHDVIQRLPPP